MVRYYCEDIKFEFKNKLAKTTARDLKIAPVFVLTPQIFELSKRKEVIKSA